MRHHLSRLRLLSNHALLDEILACAEGFVACAGDDGDAKGGLGVEPLEERVGFPVGGVGEAVHCFGAVDGYEEDVRGWVGEDVGWCWGRLSLQIRGHCERESVWSL